MNWIATIARGAVWVESGPGTVCIALPAKDKDSRQRGNRIPQVSVAPLAATDTDPIDGAGQRYLYGRERVVDSPLDEYLSRMWSPHRLTRVPLLRCLPRHPDHVQTVDEPPLGSGQSHRRPMFRKRRD